MKKEDAPIYIGLGSFVLLLIALALKYAGL